MMATVEGMICAKMWWHVYEVVIEEVQLVLYTLYNKDTICEEEIQKQKNIWVLSLLIF